jgi:hypothetical protein
VYLLRLLDPEDAGPFKTLITLLRVNMGNILPDLNLHVFCPKMW